jgi:hypothetical protein
MAIALVIIGLIVGGVLVGRDLIKAAEVRAQVTQIEKFNTATNTFYEKYGYLPGDIPAGPASQFGFVSRGTNPGQGDGNGVIQGTPTWSQVSGNANVHSGGETVVFWVDLSKTGLIEGTFNIATSLPYYGGIIAGTSVPNYLPQAKIGQGNFVYAFSGGQNQHSPGVNYFGLSPVADIDASGYIESPAGPGLTVNQAYQIDKKIDDGLPQTGGVIAIYLNYLAFSWTTANYAAGGLGQGAAGSGATPGSSTTCYDNSSTVSGTPGVAGAIQHYSVEISNGSNVSCALSFRFQ